MSCENGACAPAGTLQTGEACDLTPGCAPGLYCSLAKICAPAGTGGLNASCATSGDCERGLFCGLSGIFPVCLAGGSVDVKGACQSTGDCFAGLGCNAGICEAGALTIAPPIYNGVTCAPDTGTSFRAYFEVPPTGTAGTDFFRLPFPNEALNRSETYEINGFPGPTSGSSGGMLSQYVNVAANENGGAGTNQAVLMRFTQPIKTDGNQQVMLSYGIADANIFFYKVEPIDPSTVGAPDGDFGCITDADPAKWKLTTVSGVVNWQFLAGQTPYTCPNTLSFRPRGDNPLDPNTLYALILTTGVVSQGDAALSPDADLSVLLGATAPSDGDRLSRPYRCYGPLRAALSGKGINVGAATMFRTQDATAPVRAIQTTMNSLASDQQPRIESLVKCGGGSVVASPCQIAGDATRDCPATASGLYDEYHGQLRVPVVQAGTRPYLTEGGYIEYTDGAKTRRAAKSGDRAVVQTMENVCFALTVPKANFDTDRAVAIYGHGTGGHFRGFTREGQTDANGAAVAGSDLASSLAQGTPSLAIMSFDQPLHGTRKGGSSQGSDLLYFNVGNPRSMRDNGLQAVADYAQFTALLKAFAGGTAAFAPAVDAALASEVAGLLQNNKRLFVGHSQGGTNGALFVAVAPNTDISSVLLSGTGGGVLQSLLGKTNPVDFPSLLRGALADPNLSEYHPVMNLIQSVAERSDPINVGRGMIGIGDPSHSLQSIPTAPAMMTLPPNPTAASKSFLHVVGFADSYTPLRTSSDLWRSTAVPVFAATAEVEPGDTVIPGFETSAGARTAKLSLISSSTDTGSTEGLSCNCTPIATPFANAATDGVCGAVTSTDVATLSRRTTATTVVYRPERSYDGHFVLFENPAARAHAKTFLQTSAQSAQGFCAPTSPRVPPQ